MLGRERCLEAMVATNNYPQWPQESVSAWCISALLMLVNRVHSKLHFHHCPELIPPVYNELNSKRPSWLTIASDCP